MTSKNNIFLRWKAILQPKWLFNFVKCICFSYILYNKNAKWFFLIWESENFLWKRQYKRPSFTQNWSTKGFSLRCNGISPFPIGNAFTNAGLHPWSLTWNLKIKQLEREIPILEAIIFRVQPLNFRGGVIHGYFSDFLEAKSTITLWVVFRSEFCRSFTEKTGGGRGVVEHRFWGFGFRRYPPGN